MINTGRDNLKGRLVLLTVTVTFAVMAAIMALAATPASAHVKHTHSLSGYNYVSGSVHLTAINTPGTTSGAIYINNKSPLFRSPAYVQARPIFDEWWLNDGFWKRAVNNVSVGRAYGQMWNDYTTGNYDAFEFRICRDIPDNTRDKCGSTIKIYG